MYAQIYDNFLYCFSPMSLCVWLLQAQRDHVQGQEHAEPIEMAVHYDRTKISFVSAKRGYAVCVGPG